MAGLALAINQRLDVDGIFNLSTPIVTARVAHQYLRSVHDAHLRRIGQYRQRLLHLRVRDRIVVEVKPHVGGLADRHFHPLVGRIRVGGERQ